MAAPWMPFHPLLCLLKGIPFLSAHVLSVNAAKLAPEALNTNAVEGPVEDTHSVKINRDSGFKLDSLTVRTIFSFSFASFYYIDASLTTLIYTSAYYPNILRAWTLLNSIILGRSA